jgi:hypothetical protein
MTYHSLLSQYLITFCRYLCEANGWKASCVFIIQRADGESKYFRTYVLVVIFANNDEKITGWKASCEDSPVLTGWNLPLPRLSTAHL